MHKTERWVLFPYLAMDYKAAEDWLNQQARAGWRVASFDLKGWTVYLLPADRPDIRYCVDLSGEKARNQESYLALCHEAGWGLVETVRSMNVFCALPGADPAPIQTDPGLERDRFERIYFWKSWLLLLFMLLFPPLLLSLLWLLLEGGDPAFWYSFPLFLLSSPEGVFSALFCALAAAVVLWQLGSMLRYFLRCRAAVRSGGEMPVPSARQARLRGTGEFLLLIAYVLLLVLRLVDMSAPSYPVTYFPEERDSLRSRPVIMAEDVGLPPGEVLGRLEETGSPLLQHISYLDYAGQGIATDSYLSCLEPLARWTALALRRTSELPLAPVELGFDESWSYTGEDGFHILLLRQGKTVSRLSGAVDWTAPALREVLRTRLTST